jgi:hypothetical protein
MMEVVGYVLIFGLGFCAGGMWGLCAGRKIYRYDR